MSTSAPVAPVTTLIGSVKVTPTSVQPGQPVLVEVCDASGKPISDPTITVIIQGVAGSSRYFQFTTAGTVTLGITAAQGTATQTSQAVVTVAGTALMFRKSLSAPAVTEMPIIQISSVMGQPYAASFSLGNPSSVRGKLAAAVNKSNLTNIVTPGKTITVPVNAPVTAKVAITPAAMIAAKGAVPAAMIAQEKVVAAPAVATTTVAPASILSAPTDALGVALTKALATVPAAEVTRIAPTSVKTGATTTATLSAVLMQQGGLQVTPEATGYKWDFGDGQTLTTQTPDATHDYSASIQAADITRSFNVTCTITHDNVTVTRTLVLHSAYGMCKRLGVIVPRVSGSTYAKFNQVAFSASLTVNNLEASAITLNSMACVPLSDTAGYAPPPPKFTAMGNPVTVGAKSTSAIAVYIPVSELQVAGAQINSFAVYYSGSMSAGGTTTPVRFSYVFRIALGDQWVLNLPASTGLTGAGWNLNGVLGSINGVLTKPPSGTSLTAVQVVDPATRTVAIALPANATALQAQGTVDLAVNAGLTSIAQSAGTTVAKTPVTLAPAGGAPAPKPLDMPFNPLSPPAVAVGNECYPDDISDAAAAAAASAGLVCQLTSQVETVTVPAAFQNALQGDVILSPAPVGTGDMIAAMFKALVPPQHHGHSGMMTANFYEITHCTASPDRISSNLNKDALGIPTSLNSNLLQYAWPGSMTQSIDDATTALHYIDPNGDSYSLQSFNTDSEGEGYEVIPPLVIKPLPENEGTVRPKLRAAADIARSKGAQYDSSGKLTTKGGCYYSFYCYTDPQIAAGFTDAAPAAAGWAQGMSPAVCSSFVWLCLKENGIPLVGTPQYETLSEFSATAIAGGAQVGPQTLDGLIYYPAAERVAAANGLYQLFMEQALDQEGGFGTIPGINQAIAGPLADQLLNVFASGNPNLAGSNAWQTPGDGNAVSPDNIIFWNPPYYGYAEPLQYLPKHTEQYTVSKWTKLPPTKGTIKGKVTLNGNAVPNAHVWVYLPGGDAYTAADGTYMLPTVPIGTYALKAQAVVTTNGIGVTYTNGDNGETVTLTSGSPNLTENISLQGNALPFRRLDMSYSISCDHGDGNPFNTHGVQTGGPYTRSLDVNPGQVTNSLTYTYDYNGGGYFHIDYVFSIALLQDYSIEVSLVGTMYDDNNPPNFQTQYALPPFNVPMGGSWSGWTNMENANGYHNGPAMFTFSVTNNQQTG